VLPGTGGLTRLIDKRKVRRDRADIFCTTEEGVRGKRALDWGLVDALVPRTRLEAAAREQAEALAARSARPAEATGIALAPLARAIDGDTIPYPHLTISVNRALRSAEFLVAGPTTAPPTGLAAIHAVGAAFWPLALARALDDAILHLRANEPEIGSWVFR